MSRRWTLYGVLLVILMGGGLFQLKHAVEAKDRIVQQLHHNFLEDQRAIRVLRAEWAYLNSPAYLQKLAGRHLHLKPTAPSQILHSAAAIPRLGGLGARPLPRSAYQLPLPREKPAQNVPGVEARVGELMVRFERAIQAGRAALAGGGP